LGEKEEYSGRSRGKRKGRKKTNEGSEPTRRAIGQKGRIGASRVRRKKTESQNNSEKLADAGNIEKKNRIDKE